jgi:hypothetical protein
MNGSIPLLVYVLKDPAFAPIKTGLYIKEFQE